MADFLAGNQENAQVATDLRELLRMEQEGKLETPSVKPTFDLSYLDDQIQA